MADDQSSSIGSGGMVTKIWAAKICMNSGCSTVITNSDKARPLININKDNSDIFTDISSNNHTISFSNPNLNHYKKIPLFGTWI